MYYLTSVCRFSPFIYNIHTLAWIFYQQWNALHLSSYIYYIEWRDTGSRWLCCSWKCNRHFSFLYRLLCGCVYVYLFKFVFSIIILIAIFFIIVCFIMLFFIEYIVCSESHIVKNCKYSVSPLRATSQSTTAMKIPASKASKKQLPQKF